MLSGKSSIKAREVEQGSVKQDGGYDRAKCMADKLFAFFRIISFIFDFILICIKSVFLLGRSDRKFGGAASQWKGAAFQNGTQSLCKNIPCSH